MNFKDNNPIYLQIAERICDEILQGTYREDDRIPSVREYAAIVEVNANTVVRTFDHLQSLEVIYNKRASDTSWPRVPCAASPRSASAPSSPRSCPSYSARWIL